MENPRELCVFSLLLTRWNSGCSLLEAGASQMSHRFPQPTLPPSFLASCCLTLPSFCFCRRLPFLFPPPCTACRVRMRCPRACVPQRPVLRRIHSREGVRDTPTCRGTPLLEGGHTTVGKKSDSVISPSSHASSSSACTPHKNCVCPSIRALLTHCSFSKLFVARA